jgi:cytochrome c5
MCRFSDAHRAERSRAPAAGRERPSRGTCCRRQRTGNTMHEHDKHVSTIKNWTRPVITVGLLLVATIAVLVLLTQLVTDTPKVAKDDETAVLSRIKPVGDVQLAVASGPKGQLSGEQVYNQVCKTCHEGGLAGAPKIGDKAAWVKTIAQGLTPTVDHAIKGIRAMPAKGGNPDFDNVEIERAVVFMAGKAGANWKEPPPSATAKGAERTGEGVVQAACGKCHLSGEGGAPKVGDRAAWTPRVAKGLATVTQAALKGHGGMPARGGMAELSDTEIKRAIEYMFNSGIGKPAVAAASSAPMPSASAASPAPAMAALPASSKPDGKIIYDTTCMVCHAAGVAGAPKVGDKATWTPRLKTGIDALYASAIKGKAAMPAKGGNTSLSDADVKAAVDYMAAAVK